MIDLFLDTNVLHLFCNYNVHKCPVYKTNMMYMHMHPVKAPTINLGEGKWFHCSQKFFFLNINQVKKNSYEKSVSFLQILPISLVDIGKSDYSSPLSEKEGKWLFPK